MAKFEVGEMVYYQVDGKDEFFDSGIVTDVFDIGSEVFDFYCVNGVWMSSGELYTKKGMYNMVERIESALNRLASGEWCNVSLTDMGDGRPMVEVWYDEATPIVDEVNDVEECVMTAEPVYKDPGYVEVKYRLYLETTVNQNEFLYFKQNKDDHNAIDAYYHADDSHFAVFYKDAMDEAMVLDNDGSDDCDSVFWGDVWGELDV